MAQDPNSIEPYNPGVVGTPPNNQYYPANQNLAAQTYQNDLIEPIQDYNNTNLTGYEPLQLDSTTYTTTPKRSIPWPLLAIGGLAVLGLGMFVLLAGSGGDSDDNNNPLPDRNVVLQWWGVYMSQEEVQPLIDEYQDQNPNVTIEYANKMPVDDFESAQNAYQSELNRVLLNNDPVELPDIFMVHNSWAGDYESYVQSSSVYDLTNYTNTFHPAAVKDFANNGTVIGVPMWMDTLAIAYNSDLLAAENLTEPPTNWPRFKTVAQALTNRSGSTINQAGFAAGAVNNITFEYELANLLLIQNGVQITNSENTPTFSTDPDSVDALQFYKSFATGSDSTWNATQKIDSASFVEGNLAMMATTSWRLREMLNVNEDFSAGIDIQVSQIPQIEGQSQPILNWADYWGNMVTRNRPYYLESWQFLEWLNRPEQLRKLSANIEQNSGHFGLLYARKDMQQELLDNQYLGTYAESLPFADSWYTVKGLEVRSEFEELLNSSISSSTITRTETNIKNLIALKGILE